MEKVVCSVLELSPKKGFHNGQVMINNMGRKLCFYKSTYKKWKKFFKLFFPIDQANLFAYSCSFTLHTPYKNCMLDRREVKAAKLLKNK